MTYLPRIADNTNEYVVIVVSNINVTTLSIGTPRTDGR